MKPRVLVYDFDYTLADSSQGVIESMSYALRQLGLATPSPDRIKRTIGLSLEGALDSLAPRPVGGPEHEAFVRHFIARADEVMADQTHLYPGVVELVRTAHELGIRQGIVSNKLRRRIVEVMRRESIDSLFEVIVGAEDTSGHKPDPAALLMALERLGCLPRHAIYIGDHVVDGQAAASAEVPFVGVLTGMTSARQLRKHRPIAVVGCVTELIEVLGIEASGSGKAALA